MQRSIKRLRPLRCGATADRLRPRLQQRYSSTAAVDRTAANVPAHQATAPVQNVSATNATAVTAMGSQDAALQESPDEAEQARQAQAPNRAGVWSRSQMPRAAAMVGPRFEQTIIKDQPRPYAAIELIHRQPVRWTDDRIAVCDGGGGPLGHPRIFINVDKPQICSCTYCGLPFANEHHRAHLEAQPSTSHPLRPTADPARVEDAQRITDEPLSQR